VTSGDSSRKSPCVYSASVAVEADLAVCGMIFKCPQGIEMEMFKKIYHEGFSRLYVDNILIYEGSFYTASPSKYISQTVILQGAIVTLEMHLPCTLDGCTLILVHQYIKTVGEK